MPRRARIKEPAAIYHVMSRSIDEFNLFTDNADKDAFLDILQKYIEKFNCKIYAFCLMSNHYHLLIDSCGFDISRFMKCVNQCYVKYVNRRYGRRGHLLAERFYSKMVDSSSYLLTVSAYIHNNPKDIEGFRGKEQDYPYSSMSYYLGKQGKRKALVDTSYILGCTNVTKNKRAAKAYMQMVFERHNAALNQKINQYIEDFWNEQYEYKSYRTGLVRDKKPEEVMKRIASWFAIEDPVEILHRWKRSTVNVRRVIAYALTAFCGFGSKEACSCMNNISASGLAEMSEKGFEIFRKNNELKEYLLGNW